MATPPPYDYDTSSTRISTNWFSVNDTSPFTITISSNGLASVTGYVQNWQTPKEIVETKKEKLDRVSKEKMLASWKTYDQKDMNIIKIKQICKPQHTMNYRYKR